MAKTSAAVPFTASAELRVDITKGKIEPLPIALVNFGGEQELGAQIVQVVTSDLKRSGLFRPVDQSSFLPGRILFPLFINASALLPRKRLNDSVTVNMNASMKGQL